jgi:YVTN family beta-propeller protein
MVSGSSPVTGRALAGLARTVYVSSGRGSTVTPIATATNTAGEPIEVGGGPGSGRGPGSIAVTPDGKTAYVVVVGHPGAVVPIATATNTPGPPIEIGNHPDAIMIAPDGKTVYVANINSGTVTPIATAANTAGEPIVVGVRPRAIAVTPDGKTAYVVNQSRPQPPPWPSLEARKRGRPELPPDYRGTVTPVVTATNTPGEPIDVGHEPFAIAVTPDGKTVYVANTWENTGRPGSTACTVTPIATATNTQVRRSRSAAAPGRSPSRRTGRPLTSSICIRFGDADRDRDQHAGSADPGQRRAICDRNHTLNRPRQASSGTRHSARPQERVMPSLSVGRSTSAPCAAGSGHYAWLQGAARFSLFARDVSWDAAPHRPGAARVVSAMTCASRAARTLSARRRTTCKRQVSGSNALAGSQVSGSHAFFCTSGPWNEGH